LFVVAPGYRDDPSAILCTVGSNSITAFPPTFEKGKPPERVGRKAKGPKQGQMMFQGQPSRHNAVLLERRWRAWFLPELSSLNGPEVHHLGAGLGGAL